MCAYSVTQSCLTLCNPVDCSLPGFSIHGILQARILEWVPMPSYRGSSWPRDQTRVSSISCTAGRFFTAHSPGEHRHNNNYLKCKWPKCSNQKTQNGYKNKTPICAIYKRSTLDLSTNTDWKRKARKRYSMQTEIKGKQVQQHSYQIKQIHVDVRQRPTQYSGAIILQLKINNSLNVNLVKTKQSYFSSNSAKCTLLHF